MPLHDWSRSGEWETVHLLWIAELVRFLRPRLPEGFRPYVGTSPLAVSVGDEEPDRPTARNVHPDVGVRSFGPPGPNAGVASPSAAPAPDSETAVGLLDPPPALYVVRRGRLVAAVELVSPANKDRPETREAFRDRCLGYLTHGVHLLLVDVHPRPSGESVFDALAATLGLPAGRTPPPAALSYRVGGPAAAGGRKLAVWRRPMRVGEALPAIPLPLDETRAVVVDLEPTYSAAAADASMG